MCVVCSGIYVRGFVHAGVHMCVYACDVLLGDRNKESVSQILL